jgi:DNA replication and repair protein RecF
MVVHEFGALNFRNYRELFVRFSDQVNVLLGLNGQGKSNLVEGIYFINHLESFRTHQLDLLVMAGESAAQVQGTVSNDGIERKVRVEVSRRGRKVWLDEAPVAKLSEYVSRFFALIFNPDSLYLYRHFPLERRWFFNRYLSFVDPAYLHLIREFRVVHAQKNKLLKQGDLASLPAWNELFAAKSYAILARRTALVEAINRALPEVFRRLTGQEEPLRMELHASLKGQPAQALDALRRAQDNEARMGFALLGPHRDDFRMVLGTGRREAVFSQGEYRTALLALKLSLGRLLETERGFVPVLVLDDVFSELDATRRQRLAEYLLPLRNQVFITATEPLESFHVPAARIMEIRAGHVVAER